MPDNNNNNSDFSLNNIYMPRRYAGLGTQVPVRLAPGQDSIGSLTRPGVSLRKILRFRAR